MFIELTTKQKNVKILEIIFGQSERTDYISATIKNRGKNSNKINKDASNQN